MAQKTRIDVAEIDVADPRLKEARPAAFEGYEFVPGADKWILSKDVTLYLSWTHRLLPPLINASFRISLSHFAERYAAGTAHRESEAFKHFVGWVLKQKKTIEGCTAGDLLGYRESLGGRKQNLLYSVSRLLRHWHKAGLAGVDNAAVDLLREWRLKGDPKGVAVLTRDPREGPLTDLEFEALHLGLVQAFEQGLIGLEPFTLTILFLVTGRRPRQIGDLKSKDFRTIAGVGGVSESILNVPRIKQRSYVWRDEFRAFGLEPNIAWMVSSLLEKNKSKLLELVPRGAGKLFDELPLFPQWKQISDVSHLSVDGLLATMRTIQFHRTTHELREMLRACTELLKIPSERISGHLRIFPTRFRRTLGTRAAREGYGELTIAELLDHSDTQNVKIYTENVPENINAINRAVATQLAPMAQAFSGVLIKSESDALRGNDLTSRIRDDTGAETGICGHYGFCGAFAPIACYTCQHFQPWVDGPHEEIFRLLEAENENIQRLTGDSTIASISNRTMLAIAEVIRLCRQIRTGEAVPDESSEDSLVCSGKSVDVVHGARHGDDHG